MPTTISGVSPISSSISGARSLAAPRRAPHPQAEAFHAERPRRARWPRSARPRRPASTRRARTPCPRDRARVEATPIMPSSSSTPAVCARRTTRPTASDQEAHAQPERADRGDEHPPEVDARGRRAPGGRRAARRRSAGRRGPPRRATPAGGDEGLAPPARPAPSSTSSTPSHENGQDLHRDQREHQAAPPEHAGHDQPGLVELDVEAGAGPP